MRELLDKQKLAYKHYFDDLLLMQRCGTGTEDNVAKCKNRLFEKLEAIEIFTQKKKAACSPKQTTKNDT